MKPKLEKVLRTIKKEARGYAVDTSAGLIFYNPLQAANEYFIAGLEPKEVLSTRLGMSVVGLFASRPYGKFREYWAKRCKTNPDSSRLRKFITDASGSLIFYAPIYSAILGISGASSEEIALALPVGMTTAIITGRPYGWFLDKWRKTFRVKPVLDTYIKKTKKPVTQK